jgi:trehalose 6-phosphate phosphatase
MSRPLREHLDEVADRLAVAPTVLLCSDFDGTLAPLVDSPDQAALPPAMFDLLGGLARYEHIVPAVISGRALADVRQRVGLPGLIYAGNHGLEIAGPDFTFVEPGAAECRDKLRELVVELGSRLDSIAGVLVEDKGLTASVHYRQVASEQWEDVRHQVHTVLAGASHPFVLTPGHRVFNIRPRVYWHKGDAVLWIANAVSRPDSLIIYLGDDVTDEDAFAALPDAITVKVGDTPETTARYHLEGPAAVKQFLEWLIQRAGPANAAGTSGFRPGWEGIGV